MHGGVRAAPHRDFGPPPRVVEEEPFSAAAQPIGAAAQPGLGGASSQQRPQVVRIKGAEAQRREEKMRKVQLV